MAKSQPDFNALFYSSLGGDPAPIRYSLRSDSNFQHDVVFLSSLIHDARVKNPGAMPVDGVLAIELNRDCWELGYTLRADKLSELHVADARLELKGVRSVEWRLCGEEGRDPWIDGFEVRRRRLDDRQGFSIRLSDSDWWFVASMPAEDWSVELIDLECPYLWSQRNGSNGEGASTERVIE